MKQDSISEAHARQ